eukprot:11613028-Heterocapsa_arctica.AAC.1
MSLESSSSPKLALTGNTIHIQYMTMNSSLWLFGILKDLMRSLKSFRSVRYSKAVEHFDR